MQKPKIPIGVKLNTIISGILIISLISILLFANYVFKRDNSGNIYALTAKIAKSSAQIVYSHIDCAINNFMSIALIKSGKESRSREIKHYFDDGFLLSVSVVGKKHGEPFQSIYVPNVKALWKYEITRSEHEGEIDEILNKFEVTFKGKIQIYTKIEHGDVPIMYVAIPFKQDSRGAFTDIIIGTLDQSKIISSFEEKSIFTTFLLNSSGVVIAHPDKNKTLNRADYSSTPIAQRMIEGKIRTGQLEYEDHYGVNQLAAYSLVGIGGIGVISQVSEDDAYRATRILLKQAAILSLIVLVTSIILIYLFSHTITDPLLVLVDMTKKISQGVYDIIIRKKTSDEIGALAYAFEEMADGLQQRERLKSSFSKFVNKELAEMAANGQLALGGERKKVTIFFSDIRNFTGTSEAMEPEEVLNMLNEYMTKMDEVIIKHGGVIDKYVGDAIMAIWGAPVSRGDDELRAVKACLEMREALCDLNKDRVARGEKEIRIGMGLNTGYVIAGNMGSSEKMEYTVLGDTVNLASRTESTTKKEQTDFLMNQTTYEAVKDHIVAVPCESQHVKGKSVDIFLYKTIGAIDENGKLNEYSQDPYLKEIPDRDSNVQILYPKDYKP